VENSHERHIQFLESLLASVFSADEADTIARQIACELPKIWSSPHTVLGRIADLCKNGVDNAAVARRRLDVLARVPAIWRTWADAELEADATAQLRAGTRPTRTALGLRVLLRHPSERTLHGR
jgi:hypothetical protein